MSVMSTRKAFAAAVALLSLGIYFELFYLYPSSSRILFVQTVTFTRKVPVEVFAQYDPSIVTDCVSPLSFCAIFRQVVGEDDWGRMQLAAAAAIRQQRGVPPTKDGDQKRDATPLLPSGGVFVDASNLRSNKHDVSAQSLSQDATAPVASALVAVPPSLRNAHLRFSSKLHVIHQLQLMWHYPVSYYLCVSWLCDVEWLTANFITVAHTCVAFAAMYCFFRASNYFAYATAYLQDTLRHPANSGGVAGSPEVGVLEAAAAASPSTPAPFDSSEYEKSPLADLPPKRFQKTLSMSCFSSSKPIDVSERPDSGNDDLFGTEMSVFDSSLTSHPASGVSQSAQCRRRLILLGTFLFALRNFLDTLDGVVARAHRLRAAGGNPLLISSSPLVFGLNGHTVDTVCDFIGGFACSLGILAVAWSQPVVISRLPRIVLAKLGLRPTMRHNAALPRWVAFFGLFLTTVAAAGWDMFMIRYVNLFDVHSDSHDALFALEQHRMVRWNQFLWALTSADCIFTILTVALVVDQLWLALQCFVFIGYPWVVLVVLHSFSVWYAVVVPSPDAAAYWRQS